MKRALIVTCAVLALGTAAWGADHTLGTWRLNIAKSKQLPGGSPYANLTTTREAIEGGVKNTDRGKRADGATIASTLIANYNGKPVERTGTGAQWDTVATRQMNANTLVVRRWKRGGKFRSTARYVVSRDGKTMTETVKGIASDGKPFTAVLVFDKE